MSAIPPTSGNLNLNPEPTGAAALRAAATSGLGWRTRFSLPSEIANLGDGVRLMAANAGDHALIRELLLAVCQGPSREEFQASIDDPLYEPSDRLLVKRGGRIVSHVHLSRRVMKFGSQQVPVGEVQRLATLPEYRRAGYARRLMEAADEQMLSDGAVLAVLRTVSPQIFAPLGWLSCGRPNCLEVGVRELWAVLDGQVHMKPKRRLSTRVFRQIELGSLTQLYDENTRQALGPYVRNEAYWRWLIGRRGYDEILVAVDGDDRLEFGAEAPAIVGYMVGRADAVVELFAQGQRGSVMRELLVRACREGIERDRSGLLLHVPPGSRQSELLTAAGARPCDGSPWARETTMLKVLDRSELLRRLYDDLYLRAKEIGLARPIGWNFLLGGEPYHLTLTRRSVHFEPTTAGPIDVVCRRADFDALLLGQLDWSQGAPEGFEFREPAIQTALAALFPRHPFWRPVWDALPA